jgi:hypothetical protein
VSKQHTHGNRGGLAGAGSLQFGRSESGELFVDIHSCEEKG